MTNKLPPKSERCTARKKDGKRCTRIAHEGRRCKQHPTAKPGRPQAVWDEKQWKEFDLFCGAHESQKDIANALGVSEKTVDAICKRDKGMGFSAYAKTKRGWGRTLVAGKQLAVALGGDVQMLKHLGKFWLGQKDERNSLEIPLPDGPVEVITEVRFVKPKVEPEK